MLVERTQTEPDGRTDKHGSGWTDTDQHRRRLTDTNGRTNGRIQIVTRTIDTDGQTHTDGDERSRTVGRTRTEKDGQARN